MVVKAKKTTKKKTGAVFIKRVRITIKTRTESLPMTNNAPQSRT